MIRLNPPIPRRESLTIPHEFFAKGHRYHVEGEFVLSTSDVIELNGLSDVSQVGQSNLDYASHRGRAVHLAVQSYEEKRSYEDFLMGYQILHHMKPRGTKYASFFDDCMDRMRGYMTWRKGHTVKLAMPMEVSRVYRHLGTEYLIGATMDFPAFVDDRLTIIDLKTAHRQSGVKAQQDHLKWSLQTQSYKEAGEAEGGIFDQEIHRAVLHLHPECGKTGVKGMELGYEYHAFTGDDSFDWDAAIRMAMRKLKHGFKVVRREELIETADLNEAQGKPLEDNEEWWRAPKETLKQQLRGSLDDELYITDSDREAWEARG